MLPPWPDHIGGLEPRLLQRHELYWRPAFWPESKRVEWPEEDRRVGRTRAFESVWRMDERSKDVLWDRTCDGRAPHVACAGK